MQLRLGPLAGGDVLEQHRDLLAALRLDAECGELQVAAGGDQLALEADWLAGAQHAAIELGPAIGFVRHHFAQLLPDHVGDTGMQRVGRVCLDMDIVGEGAVRPVEELDDAEAFVDRVEQRPVALLAVG